MVGWIGFPGSTGVLGQMKRKRVATWTTRFPSLDGGTAELAGFARELHRLAVGDIGNPLRLALTDDLLLAVGLDPIADAEVNVGEVALRDIAVVLFGEELLEVLVLELVARPHIEVHEHASAFLNARYVDEDGGNRVLVRRRSVLRSEGDVAHAERCEELGADVVGVVFLRKIDVSHGVFI